jgi:hypothetical protein
MGHDIADAAEFRIPHVQRFEGDALAAVLSTGHRRG